MEVERDHVLDKPKKDGDEDPYAEEDDLLKEAEREQDEDTGEQDELPFEALESDAVFDRVMYDGAEFGMQAHPGSEEEQDYLGIPGLLEPDQVRTLLRKRQARQLSHSRKTRGRGRGPPRTPRGPAAGGHAQGTAGAAQAVEQPGGRVRPSERQAARGGAQRAAQGVRGATERGGDGGSTGGAHREGTGVGDA